MMSATILFVLQVATAGAPARQDTLPCDELGRLMIGQAADHDTWCVVSLPRSDIELVLLGATLPQTAIASTVTFVADGPAILAFGELALTQSERPRFVRELAAGGFTLTGLHRHMDGETPEIVYAHFQTGGTDARELATKLRQTMGPPPRPSSIRGQAVVGGFGSISGIPCARLAISLGALESDAVPGPGYCAVMLDTGLRVSVDGMTLPAGALVHRFAFRQTPDRTSAVVIASLVVEPHDVDGVLSVLLENGFDVVGLANERLHEVPATLTLHAQARGNPLLLGEALLTSLDRRGQKPGGAAARGSGGPVGPIR